MLNGTCDFTCKSLGVAVAVTEIKFEVSGVGSKLIESSLTGGALERIDEDDDDDDNDDDDDDDNDNKNDDSSKVQRCYNRTTHGLM